MPKSLRFRIEYFIAVLKRYRIQITIGGFSTLIAIFLTPNLLNFLNSPQFQNEYIGIVMLTTEKKLPEEILQKISYGLTAKSNTGGFIASPLVETIQESSDHKSIQIKLKNNIFWHNQKSITSDDIKTELPTLNIQTPDKSTIYIQTPNIVASLSSFLSKPILKNFTVGNGEYKISETKYQQGFLKKIKLVHLKKQKPNIVYFFYPTTKDAITGLKLGEIDKIDNLNSKDEIPTWPNFQLANTLDTNQFIALYVNTKKFDKKTRQAFAYATPKTETKKDRVLTPISPNSWAYSSSVKEYNLDPKHAKELFKGNQIKNVQLQVGDRQLLPFAEKIKKTWFEVLAINVDIVSQNTQLSNDYDIFLSKTIIPTDPDQYSFWHSTQTNTNITSISNPLIDRLLEDGRQTVNNQERKSIYAEFQKTLLEESPVIFLYYPTIYSISRIK